MKMSGCFKTNKSHQIEGTVKVMFNATYQTVLIDIDKNNMPVATNVSAPIAHSLIMIFTLSGNAKTKFGTFTWIGQFLLEVKSHT